VLSRIGELAPGADMAATSLAWYDELRMAPVIAAGFRSAGVDEAASWWVADQVRVLLGILHQQDLQQFSHVLPPPTFPD